MQQSVKRFLGDSDEQLEGRRNSLDLPTHGRVPRWLEDMSSDVERSHSLVMESGYISGGSSHIEPNNNKFNLFSPTASDQLPYSTRHSAESTPSSSARSSSSSARYGRRSSTSQLTPPFKKQFYALETDAYIVPKMDEVNFNKMSQAQYEPFGFKPVYKMDGSDSVYSEPKVQSYNPSILEQNSGGRRSRLDIIEDQILTGIKECVLNEAQASTKKDTNSVHFKSNSVPDTDTYTLRLAANPLKISKEFHENNVRSDFPKSCNSLNEDDSLERKMNFEDEFMQLKNKIHKYRKTISDKRTKYKYRKNLAAMKRENLNTEMTATYLHECSGDNKIVKRHSEPEEVFIIPELPSGTIMIVDILSTWGDRYYVGLNGIELFDSDGNLLQVKQITASPEDVNILPECNGDPRVVTNLLDGINRTQDDMHLWLTPFEGGEHHLITIEFYKRTELAMIRIWNYNKSRIHSYRGARDTVITLDGVCIFRGEIAQACGSILGGIESFGDTILFTTEEHILEKIALNDISFTTLMSVANKESGDKIERPTTATADEEVHQRPFTHAFLQKPDQEPGDQLFGAQRLDIVLLLNWGKSEYIGLTGLQVVGDHDISITIPKENLRSNNITTGAMLARVLDDENITTERKHMWYTQYTPGEEVVVSVVFEDFTYIAGIRLWNYNENLEMSFCGVRMIKIFLDNKPMLNPLSHDGTFLVRRAPGNTHYDYVQEIRFSAPGLHHEPAYDLLDPLSAPAPAKEEMYDHPVMPEGFVFQIVIYTTWGDQYYVGLNGIEIFDQNGKKIVLTESNICAHPESVNVLPGVSGDIRTPDKLVDGVNDRSDGTHSWLVPVIPKCLNRIYIVFDQPVTISVMKLWNYLKTPARGVKEFGILVDDLLIYNGILDKINDKSSVKYRTILFTNNKNILQKEMASLVKHSIDSQATIMVNDEPRVTTGGSLPSADQSLRPFTSVNYLNRGRTSQSN